MGLTITNRRTAAAAAYERNYQLIQGYNPKYNQLPRPVISEDTLRIVELQVERKAFVLTLKENPRGRFLRITEDIDGRRDSIIIPSTGLSDFKNLIEAMIKDAEEIPEKGQRD
jgi:hypothetical protein